MAMTLIIAVLGIVLVALAVLLVSRYLTTRNVGYLVLAVALVAWPVLLTPLDLYTKAQVDAVLNGGEVSYPFTLAAEGGATVGDVVAFLGYARDTVRLLLIFLGFVLLARYSRPRGGEEAAAQASRDA